MSMFLMWGTVMEVLKTAESKDRETGEIRPSGLQVQILGSNVTKLGDNKVDLQTVRVQSPEAAVEFRRLKGKQVLIPVGIMVNEKGGLLAYSLKGEPMPISADKVATPA